MLPLLLCATLPLSACAPVQAPARASAAEAPEPEHASAAIRGAIRDGNRPPPALRICAHPVDGGTPTCVDIAAGAASYRIAVAAGRYVIAAQALEDPAMKFAHAERIRCIRAPCPPDTLVELSLAPGEALAGIDLTAGAAEPPAAADG